MKTDMELDTWTKHIKGFHELWLLNGEPHPSSNAYLHLNRVYFYMMGIEDAAKIQHDLTK